MNVTCTACQTVFRVDPAKVPVAGVRARCSVCSGVFWVRPVVVVASEPGPVAPVVVVAAVVSAVAPPSIVVPAPAVAPLPQGPAVAPPVHRSVPAVPVAAPSFERPAPRPVSPPFARPSQRPSPPAAPSPPSSAQAGVAAPAPAAGAPPLAAPKKTRVNPFLSQDPGAKARRLARALISDMVVYHPAKRREGLQNGSLRRLFDEEIRKSWDEYVDQVGKAMAESTPFFQEALNEILADGQPIFP